MKLEAILENHKKWLNGEEGGEIADLSWMDLSWVELKDVDLREAYMVGTNLRNAKLTNVDLRKANLCGSDLFCAHLTNVDLREADVTYSDISLGKFENVDFFEANLSGVDLMSSDFIDCDFRWSNLSWTEPHTAKFKNCKLDGCTCPMVCPESGSFIGYRYQKGVVIKLKIPASAHRSSGVSNMCRCSEAKVLGFYSTDGVEYTSVFREVDDRYPKTVYNKGEMVYANYWDYDRWNESPANGIQFYMTFYEAEKQKNSLVTM